MNMLDQQDLFELKMMRKKADELSKDELAQYVRSWGDCTKRSIVRCSDQAKVSISCSFHLKNFNKGQNSDLFVAEYKSECDHYISMLTE